MEPNQRLEYIVSNLIRFRKLWIIPAAVGVLLALVYVLSIRTDTWSARQSLIVRDDLLGQSFKPGQFNSLESMKSAQETILEIARKPQTIRTVLEHLGPEKDGLFSQASQYPDDKTIEEVQGMISFSAPNGAEFGKTEVIILNAKSSTPERSLAFTRLLLDEIDVRISDVRAMRLQSMESELKQARDGAALSLKHSVDRLRKMEGVLGADIGTMNGLISDQPNDSSAKTEIHQIRIEKRTSQIELDAAIEAQALLAAAKENPEKMLVMSADFLTSQPMLEKLQKSLVDAQQAYANNFGRYEPAHPAVQSSIQTIEAMRRQIYLELDNITRSVESRIGELQTRIARLNALIDAETDKLASLGSQRIDHRTINSEVTKKTEIYNLAESRLAEVQALAMSTGQVEWLTRMGEPQLSTRPDGMGKKAIVMAGGFCGLMFGLGMVMLVAPPMETRVTGRPGRRSDLPKRVTEADESIKVSDTDSQTLSPASDRPYQPAPTLDEIFGPTAASAIHSASAATAATVSRGVSLARSALEKTLPKSDPTESVEIPHVSPQALDSVDDAPIGVIADSFPTEKIRGNESPLKESPLKESPLKESPLKESPLKESQTNKTQMNAGQEEQIQTGPIYTVQLPTVQLPTSESEATPNQPAMDAEPPALTISAVPTPAVTTSFVATTASTDELDANALEEAEHFRSGDQSPAERMLAEIRSTLAVKDKNRMVGSNHSPDLQKDSNYPRQKMANVRPVELVKSSQNEEMADEVKNETRVPISTPQIQRPVPEQTNSVAPPPITTESSRHPNENPFLKKLPKPEPSVASDSTVQINLGSRRQPVAANPSSETQSQGSAVASQNESTDSQTIPDQVKILAASIARFAKPPKDES
jgi:hypothetical protein